MAGAHAPIKIEWALESDLKWLYRIDLHIPRSTMRRKVAGREVAVARLAGKPIGVLRYSLFWDTIPFIAFLFVLEAQRGRRVGSGLVAFFERQMRRWRCKCVMVSSPADERAQHFWRKLRYCDAGVLALPDEPFELLFTKRL